MGGHKRTFVVAQGLQDAFVIVQLLQAYCEAATGKVSRVVHFELANGGLMRAAQATRRLGSWSFGVEQMVQMLFDKNNVGRSGFTGGRLDLPRTPESTRINTILRGEAYDVELDAHLIEWRCPESVRETLVKKINTQTVSTYATNYRRDHPEQRVPLLVSMAVLCPAFPDAKSYAAGVRTEPVMFQRFTDAIADLGREYEADMDAEPGPPNADSNYPDTTLEYYLNEDAVDMAGPVRTHSNFDDLPHGFYRRPLHFGYTDALIVCAQFDLHDFGGYMRPRIVTLLLANAHGRVVCVLRGRNLLDSSELNQPATAEDLTPQGEVPGAKPSAKAGVSTATPQGKPKTARHATEQVTTINDAKM